MTSAGRASPPIALFPLQLLHRTNPPCTTLYAGFQQIAEACSAGSRLVGGERAAPMRLPLVAGGEGGGKGGQVVVGKL